MLTRRRRNGLFAAFRYTVLTLWLAVVAFPLFWIVATSVKRPSEWLTWPPVWWSADPTLASYYRVWVSGIFTGPAEGNLPGVVGPWEALINTFIIAFTASALATLFAAVVAYGVSRHQILTETQLLMTLVLFPR